MRVHQVLWAPVLAAVTLAPVSLAQDDKPLTPPAPTKTPQVAHAIATVPEKLELGWIKPGEKGTGTVKIINTSDQPVHLLRVTSSCSCTVGELAEDQKELAPGASTELAVTLKGGHNTGPMVQRAYVWYEGSRTPFEVFVTADVSLAVKTDPSFVNLLSVEHKGKIRLESLDGRPFRVTAADGKTPVLYDLAGAEADPEMPRTAVYVAFDYTGIDPKDLNRWFVIETDHPEARELPLRVLHPSLYQTTNYRPKWTLATDRVILGRLKPGESVERELTVKALASTDEITGITVDNDAVDAELIGARQDGRLSYLTVRFKATGAATGLIKAKLNLTAKDESHDADVIVRVEEIK